jgi:uncharacterized protein (DUF2249 family)
MSDTNDRADPPIGAPIPIPPANTTPGPDVYGVARTRRLSAQAAEAAQHVVEVELDNARLRTQLSDMTVRAQHAEAMIQTGQRQLDHMSNQLDYFKRRLIRLQTWLETLGQGLVSVMKDHDPEHIINLIEESKQHDRNFDAAQTADNLQVEKNSLDAVSAAMASINEEPKS